MLDFFQFFHYYLNLLKTRVLHILQELSPLINLDFREGINKEPLKFIYRVEISLTTTPESHAKILGSDPAVSA